MSRTGLAELAGWAEARLPELIDDACAAITERVPLYAEERIVGREELHRSVEHNLRSLLAAIGQPQAALVLAAPEETGR